MDSIFKNGQEVWFTYVFEGKPYESHGMIDEVYYFNDVRKHKYKIIGDASGKPFYIWEDKISFYKEEDRDKLWCADCEHNDCSISIGRCASCACSHRLFEAKKSYSIKKLEEAYSKAKVMCDNSEPRKVCKTCKNRECSLTYGGPCRICKDHDMWESTKVNPFLLDDLVMYKDASKPDIFTVIDRLEFKNPAGNTTYSYRIKRTDKDGQDIVNLVDHDKLVKVQFKGGYEYQRGDYVRFEYDGFTRVGEVIELLYTDTDRGALYKIRGRKSANEYVVSQDKIKGLYGDFDDFKQDAHSDAADSLSYFKELRDGLNRDYLIALDKFINKEDNKMNNQKKRNRNIIKTEKYERTIEGITFNGPAVIVKFKPTIDDYAHNRTKGDKVVVVCKDGDKYDMKTGFLLAILKEFLNNQSYGNILEKLDSFDALDIPQVGKGNGFEEDKIEKHVKYTRKHIKLEKKCEDDWKFMVGDLVRLKSGNIIFKVVRTLTWNYNGKVIHRYAIQRFGGSKYTTYENENRLTLVEPTTGRLTKSMIKE